MCKYRFSLIIPTYGRKKEIEEFLMSIYNSNFNLDLIEIIIIDQNKNNLIDSIIKEYKDKLNLVYIKSSVIGLSANRNIGLSYANGKIIAFPDDDCKYLKDTFKLVDEYFDKNQEVNLVMGKIIDENGKDSIRRWPAKEIKLNKINFYTKCSSVTIFINYNNSLHIKFNENLGAGAYFGSCEDTDIIYRYIQNGCNVHYSPNIKIYHPHYSSNVNMSLEKVYNYGLGFGGFCRENWSINIAMVFVESIIFQLIKLFVGIITINKKEISARYIALISRIKGLFKYKKVKNYKDSNNDINI